MPRAVDPLSFSQMQYDTCMCDLRGGTSSACYPASSRCGTGFHQRTRHAGLPRVQVKPHEQNGKAVPLGREPLCPMFSWVKAGTHYDILIPDGAWHMLCRPGLHAQQSQATAGDAVAVVSADNAWARHTWQQLI